jgi:hypothetical protein
VADQLLGQLTVTWLTKFIKDLFERYPIQFLTQLSVEELVVVKKLTVADQVNFNAFKTISYIGSAGKPSFTASWVNYGSPYSNAGYILEPGGWVTLVGVVKSGTVGSSAFTLPPGARPASLKSLPTMSNGVFGRVDIGSDGTVTPISPSNNASVVLDGLRFKTA